MLRLFICLVCLAPMAAMAQQSPPTQDITERVATEHGKMWLRAVQAEQERDTLRLRAEKAEQERDALRGQVTDLSKRLEGSAKGPDQK